MSWPAAQVKDIVADIQAYLDTHPGVDKRLPVGASLGSVQDNRVQIGLVVCPPSKPLELNTTHLRTKVWWSTLA